MDWGDILVLILANLPVYVLIGKLFFGNWQKFWEAVKFWFTPDILSLFRGEYWADRFAEIKLGLFFVSCGVVVYAEYLLIRRYLL